ncbi:MAG: molybdopterin molybdenumtransferase MoeA [Candidatus Methanofastidiosa archaeon]|nr:molybdopterin molybdenumtransferase MoeA [Candidatus Methanofastidiosa archaeon]
MAYLKLMSFEDASMALQGLVNTVEGTEAVALEDALGRVASEDIISQIDIPPYNKSQMDGYALMASDSFSASEQSPVRLRMVEHVDAGHAPRAALGEGECAYVATGAELPKGADSVVMVEDALAAQDEVTVSRPLAPGENVMATGFDMAVGSVVVPKGAKLTPRMLAAISGVGVPQVKVNRRPKIAVISTGSEIISPSEPYTQAKTYDVNGAFLLSECKRLGCDVDFLGIATDSKDDLSRMIGLAKDRDLVLVSAGVSKGAKDLMEATLSEMGEIILHGINIKPGKPTMAAMCGGSLVIGLPGHPTSCILIFKMLVMPLLFKAMGSEHTFRTSELTLRKRIVATRGRKQFMPVSISDDGAYPVFRGSGAISSFLKAEGIAIIDENTEYLDPGESLKVILLDD